MSFIILALPRSRTAWLSHYLTIGGRHLVGHDIVIECDSLQIFLSSFSEGTPNRLAGTVETGAVLGWRLLRRMMPEAKIVTLHRPLGEIIDSFTSHGILVDQEDLEKKEAMLQAAAREPSVDSLLASDLDNPEAVRWLTRHLYGEGEWEPLWWERLSQLNIQVDLLARSMRLWERREEIGRLKEEVLLGLAAMGQESVQWMT